MRKWFCGGRSVGFGTVLALGVVTSGTALAQPSPAAPSPLPAPAAPPSPLPVPGTPVPAMPATTAGAPGDDTSPLPVPQDLVQAQPGGITADQAGARAEATSWSARASMESLRSAAARVDGAWTAFLPRLSVLGQYKRLSDFTPPSFGSGLSVGTDQTQPGVVAPTSHLFAFPFTIPLVLDNWTLQASLTVPITDYFLKTNQQYTSTTHSADAARWDVVTARAASAANGRLAYYAWLNARGAVIVAVQALNDQRTHLRDARNQFAAGNASKADVLRAETSVASAELNLEHARNLSDLTEKQLRVAVHAAEGDTLVPGEDVEAPLPPVQGNLKQFIAEALAARPEIRSAEANAESARDQVEAYRGSKYPSVSAFADGLYANPNPRYFPQTNSWNGTWDVGAQVTWSPNDFITAGSSQTDYEARAASIEANRSLTRDNIEVEVTQMLQNVHEADFSIESSTRELASAQEAYRVARELFNNGRGTSTTLTDAESDLTRARLDLLNAKFNARTARIRLEHALGRDAKPFR